MFLKWPRNSFYFKHPHHIPKLLRHIGLSHYIFWVAKEDIAVGETVLMDESFVSDTNLLNNTSWKTCPQYTQNFIPCSECTDVMFCNYDCMKANSIHKISCGSPFHRFPLLCEIAESILIGVTAFSSVDDLMMFVECALKTSIDSPKPTSIGQMKYRLFLKVMSLSHPPIAFFHRCIWC